MKPCWKEVGLSEEGAARADELLPKMLELLRSDPYGSTVAAKAAFEECVFRLEELPKRSKAFQAKYERENG
jgi:hypothetical protein